MILRAACIALCALSTPASALSCMQPDIVNSYTRAADAAEAYVVVKGAFRFNAPPRQPVDNDAQGQIVQARFEGVALGRSGFTISYTRPVTLTLACAGPWCGWVEPDTNAIAFLETRGTSLRLVEGPCPGQIFYDPTPEQTQRLLACHTRGICD